MKRVRRRIMENNGDKGELCTTHRSLYIELSET